jgi:hypothetical protein
MKHRSIIAFILLAAALVAAPQISHDLSSFKRALGARIHSQILRAFLSHADNNGNSLAPRRAETQLASCKSQENAVAQPATASKAATSKKAEGAQPRAEASVAEADAREQLAMLDTPSTDSISETPEVELTGDALGLRIREASEIAQRQLAQGELAMLVPPGTGVDVPGLADSRTNDPRARDEARRPKASEAQRRTVYLTSSFEKTGDVSKVSEEMFRRLGSTWTDANTIRVGRDAVRVKVLKFKHAGRAAGEANKAFAPKPAPVAASAPVAALTQQYYSLPVALRAAGDE